MSDSLIACSLSCQLLLAHAVREENGSVSLRLANQQNGESWEKCIGQVQFIKLRPEPITDKNIASMVQVTSMHQSPIHSLHQLISSVYAPLLLKDSEWSQKIDPGVQKLLADLEQGLRHTVRVGVGEKKDSSVLTGILTPTDEFEYWSSMANSRGPERDRAGKLNDAFEPIKGRFNQLDTQSTEAVKELLEETQNILDDVWRIDAYDQKRMAHFFGVISGALSRYVQATLGELDLWKGPFADVRGGLKEARVMLETWNNVTSELTGLMWQTDDAGERWEGEYANESTSSLVKRLEAVLRLRTTYEELLRLLSREEQKELNLEEPFEAFKKLRPLCYNPYTQPQWQAAVEDYEAKLQPIEAQIANNLLRQLNIGGTADRPLVLLRQFQRYQHLLARGGIRRALMNERETLLSQLMAHIEHVENEFMQRGALDGLGDGEQAPHGRNLSRYIAIIVWGKQLQSRVKSTLSASRSLLSDLSSYEDFQQAAEHLEQKLSRMVKEQYGNWESEVLESKRDGALSSKMSGRLMEINIDGDLTVNYSERLVTLLREVRQLSEMGFTVPSEILDVADEGEKYYRYGVMLKKVANFYNTMEGQIIPEQKRMLLDSLTNFEQVVNNPRGRRDGAEGDVTWSKPAECEVYVSQLQSAAERLSAENRKLRKAHSRLGEDVVRLMQIDLLRQKDTWKKQWSEMKSRMDTVTKKYSAELVAPWKLHWDQQVYKALEVSYQMGLESLNENQSEIKCELIFTNRKLQFRPPVEELRATYYREMKKFIAMPNLFQGFGSADVYTKMAERNVSSMVHVYEKAEELFDRILELRDGLEEWMVLGAVADLDAFVEEHVKTVEDWDQNFKGLKAKRKDAEKIPDFSKIDCINVSAAPFKSVLEDHMTRLSDALLISLRKSVMEHLKSVEAFLDNAEEKLNTQPHSFQEIGDAKTEWQSINSNKGNMKAEITLCEEKKKLLLSVAGNSIDTTDVQMRLTKLPPRWDNFEVSMEAFNEMIEEARERLKGEVDGQVQQCNRSVASLASRWEALKPQDIETWDSETVGKIFASLSEFQESFQELKKQADTLASHCESFNMSSPEFEGLTELEEDINTTQASWDMLQEYTAELAVMAEQDWISFRPSIFQLSDLSLKWKDKLKGVKRDEVMDHIIDETARINKAIPTLKFCRGEPFKEEHWTSLFRKLDLPRDVRLDTLTTAHFLGALDKLADPEMLKFVKILQARAQGEVTIREALMELKGWTETAELALLEHEEMGRLTMLIKEWKDLFLELGDNQSLLQSLKESQFFKPFADQAKQYEDKMSLLDNALHSINQIQRKWVYLEPIFGRGALPAEQGRFKRVDDEFRDMMGKVQMDPKLFNLADPSLFPMLENRLATMLDQLERCQKALADFLEEKRAKMPRFYFLGDDDLLEILGQARNPAVIQSHLKKLFQGVHKVEFSEDNSEIIGMGSVMGEIVPLEKAIKVTDSVEDWLGEFALQMKDTLRILLVKCIKAEGSADYYQQFPSQVLCMAEICKFNSACEKAVTERGLTAFKDELTNMLKSLVSFDLSTQPLMQLKVKALVLDLVHHMDVVDQLQRENCEELKMWIWQKQIRFYVKDEAAICRMSEAQFDYTYEYQGNTGKLVHTPLTDKCYLTLTQGMHMGFGGNPYGPAGTGKTESVKALGAALGRQVLVFNCDEGIDFQSMGRIFIGLVKCGAWGCFDEFNRLKEDQLSAISQQIQVIQDAIKEKTPSVKLLGRTIEVDFDAGIFVTLNPAGKGYGGRSKLPDNLKALFRPVAMGRPDNNLIAEVILYSEGFTEAKDIASKIVSLFTLSKQLLTPQQHYDWGLRALKAVLNTGGKLITAAKRSGEKLSVEAEAELLIKAVRINTLSKLTFLDSERFLSLIGDVFTGITSADIAGGELEKAIREIMPAPPFNLVVDETQIKKMLQLKESLDQRMGCVIVGPSGCGKSTVWRVLQAAMIKCGRVVHSVDATGAKIEKKSAHKVVTHVMNPKSMKRELLLGHMDLDTREWSDGVLTDAARKVVKEPLETTSWIVCDGDVDPEWIESLNSVLDDNHLLTLPNGERINFNTNVNFLFETHDLRYASPATISRMGMIFLSDEDVDVRRVVSTWLMQQPEAIRSDLTTWCEDLFYRALEDALSQEFVVETTKVGTVLNGLSHIQGASTKADFVLGLVRGLGSNLPVEERGAYAKSLFNQAGEKCPLPNDPLNCYCKDGTLMAYETRRDTYGSEDGELNRKDLEGGSVIPTISVQQTLHMIEPWVNDMQPFILVGPEGAGKNMIIRLAFRQLKSCSVTTLHCNAQTTAEHVCQKIAQSCSLFSTNSGRVYRPRDAERLVLYLKDINLPKPDEYNTCMLIAFLQQIITFQGFYDENLEFLGLERVQIVCSMNPATTVGRHQLSTRFTAIVRVCYVEYPQKDELQSVYSIFLEAFVNTCTSDNAGLDAKWQKEETRMKLAGTMVELYSQVTDKFSVDEHRHYLFTPRDLTSWVIGLLRYDVGEEELLEVWAHEAQRLFRDRLVDSDSRAKFDGMLFPLLRAQWGYTCNLRDTYYSTLAGVGGGRGESKEGDDGAGSADRLIRLATDDFTPLVQHGLMLYEREEKELDMLLFPEVLDQLAQIDRALSAPGGSLLLVGRAGVGRRNAVTLVSHMRGIRYHSPAVTRGYNIQQFYADLKEVIAVAGVEGEEALIYLEDYQLTNPAILETVNSLLSSGEVPGMYTHEELEPLLGPLKELMLEEGGDFRTPYDFMVSRVQKNLHVVLAMDQTNADFLMRCESNPALYTRCTILWLGEWDQSSMDQVPAMCLKNTDMLRGEEREAQRLIDALVSIHNSCRERGATPSEFIAFLNNWSQMYDKQAEKVGTELGHLQGGLGKLEGAAKTVDELSQSAGIKQKELGVAQLAADEAMNQITIALESASERRKEVEVLRQDLGVAEAETMRRKAEIEQELGSITPILESAKQAVGLIKSDNLNEIRSLKMPPEPIHDVLSAVLMLLGINDTSWLSMKKFLGNRGVKDEILNFDAHRISSDIRRNVSKLLKQKNPSFDHANIYRVSVAAAPLAAWVKANIRYSLVLEKIQPLENDLAEATRALEASQERLSECESELKEIDDRVDEMKKEFAVRTREAETLKAGLEAAEQTLDKAQHLLSQLSGEQKRWGETVRMLKKQQATLPMQMLLGAGFTTYLGKTPEDMRTSVMEQWIKIIDNEVDSFDYMKLLSTESQLLTWKAMGLPSDSLSMENAIVIVNSPNRCPFIIDPANACTEWLKAELDKDKQRPLAAVASQEQRFTSQVEQAVRFGKALMVLEVDDVEPMLVPLIRRDLIHQGPRWVVQVGDKVIDYNENFRILLVTRNPNPDLPPDTAALVTEVNFTVTRSGLEGQLLGVTIQNERPELEMEKSAMLKQEEDYKVKLASLEKELLEALATSEGNILENTTLIQSLTKTKHASAEIEQALSKSEEAGLELDRERNVYRPFASSGSTLFFLMRQLKAINHMYQFSLASFLVLFRGTLSEHMDSASVEDRIRRLTPVLETRVLFFVGRSLFKADRPMFGMHLVHGMRTDLFAEGGKEWDYFLGNVVSDIGEGAPRGFPSWGTADRQENFRALQENFPTLVRRLNLDDNGRWAKWSRSMECEKDFPSDLSRGDCTAFQRVLIVQTLRPDRLMSAVNKFVCEVLEVTALSPPPLNLNQLNEEETSETTPTLMITTAGADPSKELEEFAHTVVGKDHYQELAMGGGQQQVAEQLLAAAAASGDWLCLKNLHLVVAWLPVLEKLLNSLVPNPRFRLWLTTEEHSKFPLILLQSSLKVTFESPPGLKKNLQRTYSSWNPKFIGDGPPVRAQLLFILAWYHAIMQERRTYIPQGWTKFYEFSFGDLRAGANIMTFASETLTR
jgi:dynein heavy chain 2